MLVHHHHKSHLIFNDSQNWVHVKLQGKHTSRVVVVPGLWLLCWCTSSSLNVRTMTLFQEALLYSAAISSAKQIITYQSSQVPATMYGRTSSSSHSPSSFTLHNCSQQAKRQHQGLPKLPSALFHWMWLVTLLLLGLLRYPGGGFSFLVMCLNYRETSLVLSTSLGIGIKI